MSLLTLLKCTTHFNTAKENTGLAKEIRPTKVVLRNANLGTSFGPS